MQVMVRSKGLVVLSLAKRCRERDEARFGRKREGVNGLRVKERGERDDARGSEWVTSERSWGKGRSEICPGKGREGRS
jgi:hypothetical protein